MRIGAVVLGLFLALSTAPLRADARSEAKDQVDFGIDVAMRGLWREAIYRWQRAVEIDPTYAEAFNDLAVAYEHEGQLDKARTAYEKALELEPEQPSVLNYLGYSWADQRLHLDKALPMIERAVQLRPRDGYIVDSLGWVHFRLGNLEKALGYMEQAAELRPQDPTINDHLGDVYWRAGRRTEARFQWERALRLEPEPEAVPQIQKKLVEGLPPS